MLNYAKTRNMWLEHPSGAKSFGIHFLNQKYHDCFCWTCGYEWNSESGPSVGFWRRIGTLNGYEINEYICIPCFADRGIEKGWIK